jgi:hypothetical protein
MACKVPGRWKKSCSICRKPFSTHSSNRTKCHTCLPKCRERHVFHAVAAKFFEAVKVTSRPTGPVEEPVAVPQLA